MMTRLQKAATIVVLALCFAGAIGMEIWQSSGKPQPSASQAPNQSVQTRQNQSTNKETPKEKPEEAIARYNGLLAIFTAVLAVATIILGIVTSFQLWFARAEYISTHRPRIVLREAYLIGRTIHYTLVNLGGTPATVVEMLIFTEIVDDGKRLRPPWPAADTRSVRFAFTGGESKDMQYALPGEVGFAIMFPEAMRIGIEDKPGFFGKIYFVGALVYEDGLGMKRRSIFRRRWDPDSLTFVRLTPEEERDHEYAD